MNFEEFLNEGTGKLSKKQVIDYFKKNRVDDEDIYNIDSHLDDLDNTEMLGGKFDSSDVKVAVDRAMSGSEKGSSTHQNSSQSYSSASDYYKKLSKLADKIR